jgi:hypothetical protein
MGKVRPTSQFSVRMCSEMSPKIFNFPWIVVEFLTMTIRGGILWFVSIKPLVILQVSFALAKFSARCSIFVLWSSNIFKILMRGRKLMLWVLCHCVQWEHEWRSQFALTWNLFFQRYGIVSLCWALLRLSVKCLTPTSISLFEQFHSKHWILRLFTQ